MKIVKLVISVHFYTVYAVSEKNIRETFTDNIIYVGGGGGGALPTSSNNLELLPLPC